jgi:hypothetical protein
MPIMFNTLLEAAGVRPSDTRLLRHQDTRVGAMRTVYQLWREQPDLFEHYQRHQAADQSASFAGAFWASFVVTPDRSTLFVGLYRVLKKRLRQSKSMNVLAGALDEPRTVDAYTLARADELADLRGLLVIDWGAGTRRWVQRAERQNKAVLELRREFQEPKFPGFAAFVSQLSDIETLPVSWVAALGSSRGVYVLTCPNTREQYVGAAYGADGFIGRWRQYVATGHGQNIALKGRDPSDYRVAILETAGSSASQDDICAMEA